MISDRGTRRPDGRTVGPAGGALARGVKPGRPPIWTQRQLVNGIRWRTRAGTPWLDVPEWYGPWDRVYALFRRWQRDGNRKHIFTEPKAQTDAKGLITWDVSVDSTVCRAHQHAAGAARKGDLQKEPPGGIDTDPADHELGRSRAGLTTKVHRAVQQGQKPMSIVITAGQRGDSPQFEPVLENIRVLRLGLGRLPRHPDKVRADKAYGSRRNRANLRRRGIRCTIPETSGCDQHFRNRP